MAEPARKPQLRESTTPDRWDGEEGQHSIVQRWVRGSDGELELVELPLTPEIFLDPRYGDKFIQGKRHGDTVVSLYERLNRRLTADNVTVLYDVKHLLRLGRGLGPVPDVSVVLGLGLGPGDDLISLDLRQAVPSLVIEVISRNEPSLRKVDEVKKVDLYARVGIAEYFLVDLPREANGHRHTLRGLRLSSERRYQPIPPDSQGRMLSETTGLLFGVSSDGRQIDIFDAATGERLLTPDEEVERARRAEQKAQASEQKAQASEQKARASEQKAQASEQKAQASEQKAQVSEQKAQASEQKAQEEAAARAAAESELARLRAEIERLKSGA